MTTKSGALFVRSNWEEDAVWFGLYDGEAQMFEDGTDQRRSEQKGGASRDPKPIAIGAASVLVGRSPLRFSTEGSTVLVIGLKPQHKYLIETDDEELRELETDRVGTLSARVSGRTHRRRAPAGIESKSSRGKWGGQ